MTESNKNNKEELESEKEQNKASNDTAKKDAAEDNSTQTKPEANNDNELSAEKQEELMRKYDAESNTRRLTGIAAGIVFALMLAFSLFQLYTGAFGQYTLHSAYCTLGICTNISFFPVSCKEINRT